MEYYSQRDPSWSGLYLGTSKETIGSAGCVVTSLAMLAGMKPYQVNMRLRDYGGFKSGNIVIWDQAAKLLALNYDGDRTRPLHFPTIAETHHFEPNVPQHFFLVLENGRIVDPLDGKEKENPYEIVSYRNVWTDKHKQQGNSGQKGASMEIEAGITLEAINNGVILRTVPTEADGQWSQTSQLGQGDRCEVLGQTPDHQWVNVNAAGIKQGWARITDFKVVYRRDLIDKPAERIEANKDEFKRQAIAAIEQL